MNTLIYNESQDPDLIVLLAAGSVSLGDLLTLGARFLICIT